MKHLALLIPAVVAAACSNPTSPARTDAGPGSGSGDAGSSSTCSTATCVAPANATAECVGNACEISCDSGYGNCDGVASNGCEASLTTSTDCGACGHDCEGATCNQGICSPQVLASGLTDVNLLLADGANVYFVSANEIASCARTGCPGGPTALYPPTPTAATIGVTQFAMDATTLWVVQGTTIAKCPKTGCTSLTPVVQGIGPNAKLTVDDTYVYWAGGSTQSTLFRANKDGSHVVTLLTGATGEYYEDLTVAGSTLYFLSVGNTSGVLACATSGCASATPLFPDVTSFNFNALYADASGEWVAQNGNLYFTAAGSTQEHNFGLGPNLAFQLATLGSYLVWGERIAGTILAEPKNGGSIVTLASGSNVPETIATDATALYFTTSDGEVVKLVP